MKLRYDMVQCYVVRRGYGGGHELLQVRRTAGDFLGGTWQSVYGDIQAGETAWQAALRELQEETGLRPLEFYQLDTINTFYLAKDDAIWNCPGFCALVPSECDVRLNEEHDAFRWLNREQFGRALMWQGEKQAYKELCEQILDDGPAKPYLRIPLAPEK